MAPLPPHPVTPLSPSPLPLSTRPQISEAVMKEINRQRDLAGIPTLTNNAALQSPADAQTNTMVTNGVESPLVIEPPDLIAWGVDAASAVTLSLLRAGNPSVVADAIVNRMLEHTTMRSTMYGVGWASFTCVVHREWNDINYVTCIFARP